MAAAVFLMINGLILLGGERLRRASMERELAGERGGSPEAQGGSGLRGDPERKTRRLDTLEIREAGIIGGFQSLALIAGFSRDGIVMVGGLSRGLNHRDAAKFAFLLATPIILAAGFYKIPDLFGSNGNGVRGQVLAGSVVTFFVSLLAVRFLYQYFKTRTLTPFGIYCLAFGAFMVAFVGL
jgi:undecaprenyl-diphosphatase